MVAKKASKKLATKVSQKKVVKVEPTINLWELANDLETLANKVDNAVSALDVVAQNIMNNPESGAIWMVVDVLKTHVETIEDCSKKVMKAHRENMPLEQQKENEHLWKLMEDLR